MLTYRQDYIEDSINYNNFEDLGLPDGQSVTQYPSQQPSGLRPCLGRVIEHKYFESAMLACIVINAILMGAEPSSFVTENPKIQQVFDFFDLLFLLIFTLEVSLQLLYRGVSFFRDVWLIFDLAIISLSWNLSHFSVFRAFRIFRAIRLIGRVGALRDLTEAMVSVMPRMLTIGGFLLLFMCIFAVLLTTLFRTAYQDGYTDEDYFSRLDLTFFTLFQMITMDSWGTISRQIMKIHAWAGLLMTLFAVITSFIAMNLVIAVLCDSLIQLNGIDENDEHIVAEPPVGTCRSKTFRDGREVDSANMETWRCQKSLQMDADCLLVQVEKLRMTQMESLTALQQVIDKRYPEEAT